MMNEAVPRSGAPTVWQLARYINCDCRGSYLWVTGGPVDRGYSYCCIHGHKYKHPMIQFCRAPNDPSTGYVMLCVLELLPEFTKRVPDNERSLFRREPQAATAVNKATNANPKGD